MKKILLFFAVLLSVASFAQGPEFELYTGIINPKADNTTLGYMIGLNTIPHLYQVDKNNSKKQREYLNKYLIGFEFSGYQTNPVTTTVVGQTPTVPVTDCQCTTIPIGVLETDGIYISKQDITALSLNFGIEIYKGWFLLGGVSSYKHREIINNEILDTYRNTYIDAGVKKFFHVGRVYLSPTFKFNPEVTSFGIGFSYF